MMGNVGIGNRGRTNFPQHITKSYEKSWNILGAHKYKKGLRTTLKKSWDFDKIL